jgi:riboflavin transporter FmnP
MFRKSVTIANIIVFSSFAIILTASKAEVPFPILPYLKFDFAEIPVMIVLLLFGPIPSLLTETVHWLTLTLTRGDILGPLLKFLAVVPMVLGFWIGVEMYKRLSKHSSYNTTVALGSGLVLGIVLRVIVTTLANIVVLLFVAPGFISDAQIMLRMAGISVISTMDVLLWTLLFTAIFNVLHVPLSSFVAVIAVKGTVIRLPSLTEKMWIPTSTRRTKEPS